MVYSSIDIERVQAKNNGPSIRHEFNLNDKIIVAIIAALSPEKDHITFLKAANILLKRNKNFHFLIVGKGKEEENIRLFINEHNLASSVTLTGFRDDVPNVLSESNYFTMTSTEEGLGSSILEAFANKIPVVATDVGGIPEIVIHGESGLLAQKGDIEAIASHILALENNTDLKQTLIDNAYNIVKNKFNIEHCASQTAEIYWDIMHNQKVEIDSKVL